MRWLIVQNLPQEWERGVALFYPKNLEKGEPIIMSNKFFKKSLRLLALLAMVGVCQEAAASSLLSDTGTDYDTVGAVNLAPRNTTTSLISLGIAGTVATPTGAWTLDSGSKTFLVASSLTDATAAVRGITYIGTMNAANKSELFLLGNNAIDFSAATLAGPTTAGTYATIFLLNSPAGFSTSGGTSQKTVLPAASALTGNWIFESLNDESALDSNATNTALPAFTMKASKSVYFGGIRGLSGTNSYATTFGGSANAVVTGPGTVKLGTAFTTLNPLWTGFTGAIETNSAVTLGSTSYPLDLAKSALIVNSAHTVTMGSLKPTINRLASGNASAGISAATGAVVTINELDLTAYGINLTSPASAAVTYIINSITAGSDQPLTLTNSGASLSVTIKKGRTDGGIIRAGTIAGITLVTP